MNKKIFLSPPDMSGKELDYIKNAFAENYISTIGSNIRNLESEIKNFTGAHHVLATNSGTSALHLALRVLEVNSEDYLIASSFTFIGSVVAALYEKAHLIFIDSDQKSWNLDANLLEQAIKICPKKPKALIVTHLYGQMADIIKIVDICKQHQIAIIEDSAESLGANFENQQSGTFGDFGIFSFNGNKIITASSGGVLIAKNKTHIQKAKFLSTQAKEDFPHYEHYTYGYNYAMSNVLAGIALAQLEILQQRIKARREIFQRYQEALKLEFMPELKLSYGNRWLSTVLFRDFETREKIRLKLAQVNIESRPLWKPMHLQKLFQDCHYISQNYICDDLFNRGLCLPSGSNLKQTEQEFIIQIIKEAL